MKTIIAGSRYITGIYIVHSAIAESGFKISEVVCGCAKGVDTVGEDWAKLNGIPVKRFPADWKNISHDDAVIRNNGFGPYDAKAGVRRNQEMAEYADALIAVWDKKSKGTQDMIERAVERNLKLFIKYL